MTVHHPSETILLLHAAGRLAAPHAQVVAIHVAGCRHCAAELRLLDAAAGALLEDLAPAPLHADALGRTLDRLDGDPPLALEPLRPASAIEALANGRWRWRGPGIHMMTLARRDPGDTRLDLIRVAPGTALLEHGHGGLETTVVLQGAFEDGIARYQQGDFAEADGALDHQPRALDGPDCICLIATSGHLKARGLLGRVVRPLLGM